MDDLSKRLQHFTAVCVTLHNFQCVRFYHNTIVDFNKHPCLQIPASKPLLLSYADLKTYTDFFNMVESFVEANLRGEYLKENSASMASIVSECNNDTKNELISLRER